MTPPRVRLITPLTPAQCVTRIGPLIDSNSSPLPSTTGLFGSKRICGNVTELSLFLHQRHPMVRPPFHAFLNASICVEAQHTIIDGEVKMHLPVQFFLSMMFIVALGIGTVTLVSTITLIANSRADLITFAVFSGMVIIMIGIAFSVVRCTRGIIRDETRCLTRFLIRTLDAQEQPNPSNEPTQ